MEKLKINSVDTVELSTSGYTGFRIVASPVFSKTKKGDIIVRFGDFYSEFTYMTENGELVTDIQIDNEPYFSEVFIPYLHYFLLKTHGFYNPSSEGADDIKVDIDPEIRKRLCILNRKVLEEIAILIVDAMNLGIVPENKTFREYVETQSNSNLYDSILTL